jgi:transposase
MTKRRTYTKEFKIEAVELADKIGNTAQAERDLGIPNGQVYKWRDKLEKEGEPEKAFPGKGNVRDAEMKALKRRLDRVEEENAILKKAIGIFSTAPVEQRPR